jgi:hypothetical protein
MNQILITHLAFSDYPIQRESPFETSSCSMELSSIYTTLLLLVNVGGTFGESESEAEQRLLRNIFSKQYDGSRAPERRTRIFAMLTVEHLEDVVQLVFLTGYELESGFTCFPWPHLTYIGDNSM